MLTNVGPSQDAWMVRFCGCRQFSPKGAKRGPTLQDDVQFSEGRAAAGARSGTADWIETKPRALLRNRRKASSGGFRATCRHDSKMESSRAWGQNSTQFTAAAGRFVFSAEIESS